MLHHFSHHHVHILVCVSLLGLHVKDYNVEKRTQGTALGVMYILTADHPRWKKKSRAEIFWIFVGVMWIETCWFSHANEFSMVMGNSHLRSFVFWGWGGGWLQKCHQMGKMEQKLMNHQKAKKLLVGDCSKILLLKSGANSTDHREVVKTCVDENNLHDATGREFKQIKQTNPRSCFEH